MARVEGDFEPQFRRLRDLLADKLESGEELGASIAVDVDGKTVVDIWGGYSEAGKANPWSRNTITNVWSSTKAIAALATLILVSRGKLDLDEPVATYWPEFAVNGKSGILVRHLLSHTAGLSAWEVINSHTDTWDRELAVSRLAEQAPWWEPGTASGYHLVSFGALLGELVRRTSGRTMKEFVAEEIASALPDADFQIGVRESDYSRVSLVIPPPPGHLMDFSTVSPASIPYKTFHRPAMDPSWPSEDAFRNSELPAINGHGNARSLVKALSAITLGGEVDGVKLLSPATIERIFDVQADGVDLALQIPMTFGIGYGIDGPGTRQTLPWMPKGRVCFWGGFGGSVIICDLDRKMTFSYVMNKMGLGGVIGNLRTPLYVKEAYNSLGLNLED
jgi:CubicO group peptidase (beta-lactamase class C family)